jgi:hypothetical protein
LPANKDKKPDWFVLNGKSKQQTSNHIQKGENTLIKTSLLQKLVQKAAKQTKRRAVIVDESDEDDDSYAAYMAAETGIGEYMEELRNNSIVTEGNNDAITYSLYPFHTPKPPNKRSKHQHYTAEIIVETVNNEGIISPLRALLDTGTSATSHNNAQLCPKRNSLN